MIADSLTIVARQKKPKTTGEKIHSYTFEDLKRPKKITEDIPESARTNTKIEEKPKEQTLPKIQKKAPMKEIKTRFGGEEEKKEEEEPKYRFLLDYTIDSIKKKYLFPFNESKTKSNIPYFFAYEIEQYQNLMDDPNTAYLPKPDGPENEIFTSKKYCFPFSQVNVPPNVIKDLQVPLKVKHYHPSSKKLDKLFGYLETGQQIFRIFSLR